MISLNPDLWISFVLVIFVYSFLYKDNVLYRFAENMLVGVSVGYIFVQGVKNSINVGINPLIKGEILAIIPIILGIVLYLNFSKKYFWVSRYPLALIVGLGTGISMRGVVKSDIVDQISASMLPLLTPDPLQSVNNLIIVVTCITVLFYFIYTYKASSTKLAKYEINIRQIARYFMMACFGAGFANYVTSQFSKLAGVIQNILYNLFGLL